MVEGRETATSVQHDDRTPWDEAGEAELGSDRYGAAPHVVP